jgi:hypothetical protein
MKRRILISLCSMTMLSLMSGCLTEANEGPGMIATFTSLIQGRSISIKSTRLPGGQEFSNPGSFGGRRPSNWRTSGATMGVAGDRRELPEWVEFEWSEPVYPEDPNQTLEQYRALPRKKERVLVRDRIPREVVQEVNQSRRDAFAGTLPDKKLWVYFVWTDAGIKFHWRLISGASTELRSGGDNIDSL